MKDFYSGSIYIDKKDCRFSVGKIKVVSKSRDLYELDGSYFISGNISVKFIDETFPERYMEQELEITKNLTVMYSADKEKIVSWLNERRKKIIEETAELLKMIENSEIKDD